MTEDTKPFPFARRDEHAKRLCFNDNLRDLDAAIAYFERVPDGISLEGAWQRGELSPEMLEMVREYRDRNNRTSYSTDEIVRAARMAGISPAQMHNLLFSMQRDSAKPVKICPEYTPTEPDPWEGDYWKLPKEVYAVSEEFRLYAVSEEFRCSLVAGFDLGKPPKT